MTTRTKLVLILGAGASRPFRFPTASELREIIIGGDGRKATLEGLLGSKVVVTDPAGGGGILHDIDSLVADYRSRLEECFERRAQLVSPKALFRLQRAFLYSDRVSIDTIVKHLPPGHSDPVQ